MDKEIDAARIWLEALGTPHDVSVVPGNHDAYVPGALDKVLGAWMIASVAGTMIAQVAQAMEFGATSEDIAYTCHAHPTHSEAIKEVAMAVTGKPMHM